MVERTFAAAAAESAGCSEDALRPLLPGAFRTLYHETFVSRAGWRLRPHAADTLAALSAWREARPASETDLKVGVISNWDDRLPLLLERRLLMLCAAASPTSRLRRTCSGPVLSLGLA